MTARISDRIIIANNNKGGSKRRNDNKRRPDQKRQRNINRNRAKNPPVVAKKSSDNSIKGVVKKIFSLFFRKVAPIGKNETAVMQLIEPFNLELLPQLHDKTFSFGITLCQASDSSRHITQSLPNLIGLIDMNGSPYTTAGTDISSYKTRLSKPRSSPRMKRSGTV